MTRFYLIIFFVVLACLNNAACAQRYCSNSSNATRENRLLIKDHRSDSIDIIRITIDLDMTQVSNSEISGEVTIEFIAKIAGVNRFTLDFEGLTTDTVFGDFIADYATNDTQLILNFNQSVSTGTQQAVSIAYHGSPMKDASGWGGFYFSGAYAWNLGVGFADDPHSYGRIWFPCFDNFIEKSAFEINAKVNAGKKASSNGILTEVILNGDSTSTYHWVQNQPISSYLACINVGPYVIIESSINGINGNIPVQLFSKASDSTNLKNSFAHLDEAVIGYENAYGPYRFDKVGYSLVPFNSGAMEHATNIAYPIYAVNGNLNNESLMAHELAHMWWGDNITCETDGDMWINEGWASFSAYLFEEFQYGRAAYELAVESDLKYMLQNGHHFEGGYRPVAGQTHEYVYGDHVYKKGALVAHNLRGYMGDSLFFDAVHQIMEKFKYASVSSDSLEKYFSIFSGIDLSFFFKDWVFNPGYNVIVLDSYKLESGTTKLYVQQKLKGANDFHTNLPVFFTAFDEDWNISTGQFEMSGQFHVETVDLPFKPSFIVLYDNIEQAQAMTRDKVLIKSTGTKALKNVYLDINFTEVADSALLYFDHIWAAPDPIKLFDEKPFKMSNYHYWRIYGIGLENVIMNGQYVYDGRLNSSNGTYLDQDLVSQTEDSLVLLYRNSTSADWNEYEYYSKDILGSNDNALGLIKFSKVLPGEYVLANMDHSVLRIKNSAQEAIVKVYPNPTKDELNVEFEDVTFLGSKFVLMDSAGSVIISENLHLGVNVISTTRLASGEYIYHLKSKNLPIRTGKLLVAK